MTKPAAFSNETIHQRLYRLARLLLAYGTPDGILQRFLQALCEDLQSEAGYLVVRREAGFQPIASVRYQLEDRAELHFSSTVVRSVLRQRRPLLIDDIRSAPWLNTARSIVVMGLRSLVCVPILLQGEPLAVLYLENRNRQKAFPIGTLEYLGEAAQLCAGILARIMETEQESPREWIPSDPATVLTPQEERVGNFLKRGYTNRQIAEQLGISHETVKVHLQHLYTKLGVRNRSAATYLLSRWDDGVY